MNELQVVERQEVQAQTVQQIDYVPSVAVELQQAAANLRKLEQIKREIMRDGIDYATIPGTDKPSLLKPGAERLLQFYGLGHKVQCVEKVLDWEKGFFYFCYRVSIIKSYPTHEIVVAECEGSANSMESRYRDRWVTERKLKEMGLKVDGRQYRVRNGQYGQYKEYKIENPDPYSIVNTLQKMAIKRAFVGATLQATGTSEFFTQDIEDNPEAFGLDPEPPNGGRKPQQQTTRNTQAKPQQQKPQQQKPQQQQAKPAPAPQTVAQEQQQQEQQQEQQQSAGDRNLDAWKALAEANRQQQPKKETNQRGRFFAICAKRGLKEKAQKAIVFGFTGKESRANVTNEEFKTICDFLEEATNEKIQKVILEAKEAFLMKKEIADVLESA